MPVTYPDRRVAPTARKLLDCLAQAALNNPKPPAVVGFRTGTEGQPLAATNSDECCTGAAFVRIVRTYPSWSAPSPSGSSVRCAQPMAAEFEISMWRCAPMGTLQSLPAQELWDELNIDLLNDRATMMDAICCFIGLRDQNTVMYGEWTTKTAEGGCSGSVITVQADLYGSGV